MKNVNEFDTEWAKRQHDSFLTAHYSVVSACISPKRTWYERKFRELLEGVKGEESVANLTAYQTARFHSLNFYIPVREKAKSELQKAEFFE